MNKNKGYDNRTIVGIMLIVSIIGLAYSITMLATGSDALGGHISMLVLGLINTILIIGNLKNLYIIKGGE